ncbi:MAG: T9SS type A sorting domain-containing protein [Bacteroidales bacterium]|nr:T9SS type A sorting domain-containing protein [Bacteroidales bacterium]
MKTFIKIITIFISYYSFGQSTPSNFDFITSTAANTSYSVNGYGSSSYPNSATYNVVFGYSNATTQSNDYKLASFEVNSNTYNPITLPNGECYSKVVVNRMVFPSSPVTDLGKQTIFFELGSKSGTNLYMTPSYTNIQEAVNTRILNRGGDNVFSNTGGQTLNNIERIDLMIEDGVFTPDNTQSGFLINERGGNDEFIVAAITGLDANGDVSSVGSLVSIATSDWGNTGYSTTTTVFQRGTTDTYMRPNQDLTSQNIYGVFISYQDLGIANNTTIYGIAIFPGDVNSSMDLIGLSDVPWDTDADSYGSGGLDLMGGGGYFATADVIVTDLQTTITSNTAIPSDGDIVDITVRVDNNGPMSDDNISVTATIPDGYIYQNLVSGYTGSVSVVGSTITWTFPALALNDFEELTFQVEAEAIGDRTFTSTVSGTKTDVVPGNNPDNLELLLDTEQSTLPVSLISFKGFQDENSVNLEWKTASEINNHYFEVQRWNDQLGFETIGEVEGNGTSNILHQYLFQDLNPVLGVNYYRLVQHDFDGASTVFPKIAVNVDGGINDIHVFPNPIIDKVSFSNFNRISSIFLYDMRGKMLMSFNQDSYDYLDLSGLGKGVYFLEIQSGSEKIMRKIIKL